MTMAPLQLTTRRVILAGALAAAAVVAPVITAFSAAQPSPAVACVGGEEEDIYSEQCVPHTVPNSYQGPFVPIPGNPDLPAVSEPGGGGEIPCNGANSGACIGLAEEAQAEGPAAVPHSEVESSPTVTGSIG